MERIRCYTLFDITQTGVTNHRRVTGTTDRAGQSIDTPAGINRSRNQQRNFETIIQLISLRIQPFEITVPVYGIYNMDEINLGNRYIGEQKVWTFDFSIEGNNIFGIGNNPTQLIDEDCKHVPMILNLTETADTTAYITVDDNNRNLRFDLITHK